MHGEGSVYFTNGDTYTGQVLNDFQQGIGCYTWKNNDVYQGEFLNNKKEG